MSYRPSPGFTASILAIGLTLTTGMSCEESRSVQLERELLESREANASLEEKLAKQAETIRELQSQVAELRGFKGDMMAELVVPTKIRFASRSGGYNEDGKAGDDGLLLHVQPVDRDGDVVKSAGSFKVALHDLALESGSKTFAEYSFDQQQTRSMWLGQLMTNHFTMKCPWPEGEPPKHSEITADVFFTDRLTGQVLRAQNLFKVTLPPSSTEGG